MSARRATDPGSQAAAEWGRQGAAKRWLKSGDPPDTPAPPRADRSLSVLLGPGQPEQARRKAHRLGISTSAYIRRLLAADGCPGDPKV